jgi:Tol biopolymer transport system component
LSKWHPTLTVRLGGGVGALLLLLGLVAGKAAGAEPQAAAEAGLGRHPYIGPQGPPWFHPAATRQAFPRTEVNLTQNPADDIHPAWSPDGQTLAFSSNRSGTYQIWLMDPDGRNLRQLTQDPGNARYPAWSSTGTKIAFSSDRHGVSDLYIIDIVTRREQRVTQGNVGNATHPSWFPGGDKLVFASNFGGNHLWVVSVDGTGARPLTSGPSSDSDPQVAPDGSRIVFVSNGRDRDGDGQMDSVGSDRNLWVMNLDGSGQTQVTFEASEERDPAWLADPLTGAVSSRLIYSSNRNGNYDLFVLNLAGGSPLQVSPAGNVTTDGDPSPDPNQRRNPQTAFTSRRQGNNDIWLLRIEDLNPPVLSDGKGAVLPTVTPRQALPGSEVKITAHVYDGESGVAEVYALFKAADQPAFVSVSLVDAGILNDANGDTTVRREIDQFVIDARDYSLQDPRELSRMLQPFTFAQAHGLRLFDDGPAGGHGDAKAGDGIYTNRWKTPSTPRDYYVDIVPIDHAGNVPGGPVTGYLGHLEAAFGQPLFALGYDHVAGFTTQSFGTGSRILFISDYACGQRFLAAGEGARYWPVAVPAESYYLNYAPEDQPAVQSSQSPPAPVYNHEGGGFLSPRTREPALGRRSPTLGFGLNEPVDVWRILCRGPIDFNTLSAYLPIPVTDPDPKLPPRFSASKMVIWASPYSGDVWVGPGTIVDPSVQAALSQYLSQGGRLFLTGQDIAWALTLDGTRPNAFLTNDLGVQFLSDRAADTFGISPIDRHNITATGLIGTEPFPGHWVVPGGLNVYPDALTLAYIDRAQAGGAGRYVGDACPNQFFIDDVTALGTSAAELTFDSGGGTAGVRYTHPTTGARTVFFSFGLEGVDNAFDQQQITVGGNNVTVVLARNHRLKLMSNIASYLRTGTLRGRITKMDGQTPLAGVVVTAQVGGSAVATAVTREDGTFFMEGLEANIYTVTAARPGFTAERTVTRPVEAGLDADTGDIRLLELSPGSITGKVTEADGTTPVPGATVTAVLQNVSGAGEPLSFSTQSGADGTYTLSNMPAETYTVTASKAGFSSAQRKDVVVVQGQVTANVDLQLTPPPGSISGQVVRQGTSTPIRGATVRVMLNRREIGRAITDVQGRYKVEAVPAGTYTVEAAAAGFRTGQKADVRVQANQETPRIDFALEALPPGRIVGQILNVGDGLPVGGARVELLREGEVVAVVTSSEALTTEGGYTFNYQIPEVPAGSYTVRVSASGFSGATTADVNFRLEPLHIFPRGLIMASAPFDYTTVAPDIGLILDDDRNPATPLKMATYDPSLGRYLFYPQAPADTFRLGAGYWLLLSQATPFTREGFRAATDRPFSIPLQVGWNLIGTPFEYPVDWLKTRVRSGGVEYALQEAMSRGILNNTLFTYSFGQYRMVFRLDPWVGYWIRAFTPCELLIDPEPIPRSAAPARDRGAAPTRENWQVQFVAATATGLRDEENLVGVQPQATNGFDPGLDQEEPPPAPAAGFLRLSFPHRDWGAYAGRYRSDIRGAEAAPWVWEMEVETDQPGVPVTLSWPHLGAQLPDGVDLTLEDLETGSRQYLPTTSHYTFTAGAKGTVRRFRVVAQRRSEQALTLTGLAIGTRGSQAAIHYTLSRAARVEVQVQSLGGQVLRTWVEGASRAAGPHVTVWDGRDAQGRPLPAGSYLVVVQAMAEDGRAVRAVRTLEWRP